MWLQKYADLFKEYRSHDYYLAVQGIVDFFHDKCKGDTSRILEEYRRQFNEDKGKDVEKRLHSQRRMIAQYYHQLDECLSSPFMIFHRKKILKDYTKAEGSLLKIVYFMGLAVEESPEIYKDISTKDHLPKLKKNATTMDRHIYHIMNVLSKKK